MNYKYSNALEKYATKKISEAAFGLINFIVGFVSGLIVYYIFGG